MASYYKNIGKEWITLAAGWTGEDGMIKVVLNEYLRPGQPILLKVNTFKQSGSSSPDYLCRVHRDLYAEKDGELLRRKAEESEQGDA